MQDLYVRAVIALLAAGILVAQARRFPQQKTRARALVVGAVGALLIATANLLQALVAGSVFVPALFLAGGCLFVVAVILLIFAYRRGELAEQMAAVRTATADERRRRAARETEQKPS